jgi:hypothetical protein
MVAAFPHRRAMRDRRYFASVLRRTAARAAFPQAGEANTSALSNIRILDMVQFASLFIAAVSCDRENA